MALSDLERLRHMLEAAEKAIAIAGESRAVLDDEVHVLALTRLIEIVGEAAKNVSRATKDRYPGLPWREMAGTRDRLIHGYSVVDLDILWDVVHRKLPPLIPALKRAVENEIGGT